MLDLNIQEFLTNLEIALDADPGSIKAGQPLSSIPAWDSLAVIGFISMADAKYGRRVSPAGIRHCKNVDDLMGLVASD